MSKKRRVWNKNEMLSNAQRVVMDWKRSELEYFNLTIAPAFKPG
jgi:hypothetical protein